MKERTPKLLRCVPLMTSLMLAAASLNLHATLTYWDPLGTSGTATSSYSGTWENNSWSTTSAGTATPVAWVNNTAAAFGFAGATGSSPAYTVTMNSLHTVAGFFNGGLTGENSTKLTIAGPGPWSLPSGAQAFSCGLGGSTTITTPIQGAGQPTAEYYGNIYLQANNTFTGGILLGYGASGIPFSGKLFFPGQTALNTGTITVGNIGSSNAWLIYEGTTAMNLTNKYSWTNSNSSGVTFAGCPAGWTNSGTFTVGSGVTAVNLFADGTNSMIVMSGVISGGKAGGYLNVGDAPPSMLRLSGANTHVLTTTISNGVVQAGNNTCIPLNSANPDTGKGDLWVYNPGVFDINGFSPTVSGLVGDGIIDNNSGTTGTLSVGTNNTASTFYGTIQSSVGSLNFTKIGSGTLTFQGSGTYNGNTSVNNGTLIVPGGNTQIPNTSPVTVGLGATLDIQGNSMTLTNLSGRGNIINNSGAITIIGNFVTNGSQVTYSGFSGNIDNGSLIKNGTETMALRGSNNNLVGDSSGDPGVQLNSGALVVGAGPNRIVANGGASVTIGDGAVFELAGSPGESVGQLAGTGFIDLEGGSLIVNAGVSNNYGGVIRDSDLAGSSTALGHGLRGYYYNHQDFTALGAVRDDAQINFPDLTQTSNLPPGIIQGTNFCVRWIGQVLAPVDGSYQFNVNSDDGCRLWVNGQCVVDNWITKGAGNSTGNITLAANTRYDIIVEYFQQTVGASCKLLWTPPGDTVSTLIPSDNLFLPGAGSLVKDGFAPLTLTGSSSYSGTTIVKGGTLEAFADGALGNGSVFVQDGAALTLANGAANNYIADSADLILSPSAHVNVNFTGTDTVRSLSLDGGATYKVAGTYGQPGSGAQFEDSHFTGTGFIRVMGLPSTTTLGSSTGNTVYGSSVTLTAVAHGTGATPTGTITFFDGSNAIGTVAVDGTGTAVLAVTDLTVANSPHTVTAVYNGDATYGPSTSSATSQTVTPITLTGVTGNNKQYDQTATATLNLTNLTGVLPVDSNFVQIASGYVATFADKNAGSNKTVTASGIALTGGAAGNYSIAATATTTGNINPKPLTITNILASNKVYDGTVTATLDFSKSGMTGSSTNIIYSGDDATTNYSAATGAFTNATVGTSKTINVTIPMIGADAGNYVATGTAKANITIANSALTLTSSANPANSGDNVNFSATASATNGVGVPTGNVIFLNNGVAFATVALSGGVANSGNITTLPQGTNTITAQYAGDVNFIGSTNTLQQVINAAVVQPTLTINQSAGQITITWSGNYNLQSVNALQSSGTPWQTVAGATSPYSTPITNAATFYRLSN